MNSDARLIAVNALWNHAADQQFSDDTSVATLKELTNDENNRGT